MDHVQGKWPTSTSGSAGANVGNRTRIFHASLDALMVSQSDVGGVRVFSDLAVFKTTPLGPVPHLSSLQGVNPKFV